MHFQIPRLQGRLWRGWLQCRWRSKRCSKMRRVAVRSSRLFLLSRRYKGSRRDWTDPGATDDHPLLQRSHEHWQLAHLSTNLLGWSPQPQRMFRPRNVLRQSQVHQLLHGSRLPPLGSRDLSLLNYQEGRPQVLVRRNIRWLAGRDGRKPVDHWKVCKYFGWIRDRSSCSVPPCRRKHPVPDDERSILCLRFFHCCSTWQSSSLAIHPSLQVNLGVIFHCIFFGGNKILSCKSSD